MKSKKKEPDRSVEAEGGVTGNRGIEDDLGAMEKSLSAKDEHSSESQRGDSTDKKSRRLPLFGMILLLCSLSLGLLLAALGLHFIKSKKVKPSQIQTAKVQYVISLNRPVPQADNREMLDFLIIYQVQGSEMITALRMEAGFRSLSRYANFKKNPVLFRETVYSFLLQQNAAENTAQTWRSVFGKNLLDYLKVKLPESCPDTIRMTQLENL